MKGQLDFSISKLLILCLFLLLSDATYAQVVIGGNYHFITDIPKGFFQEAAIPTTPKRGNTLKQSDKAIVKNRIVKVVDIDANNLVYYKYWKFKKNSPLAVEFNGLTANIVFNMPLDDFEKQTEPVYGMYKGVSAGTYTVPFKLRGVVGGGDFDFESSLSLQANVVVGFGKRTKQTSWFDASLGIGLTGIDLNSLNSNVGEEPRSATAFTVSLGGVIKFNPNVNAGIFGGWDLLSAKDRAVKWEYHGKLWLGLGINVSFTEAKSEENTTPIGKQPGE